MLFIFSAAVFASCQKELSGGNAILPSTGSHTTLLSDSIYLAKIIYLETTGGVTDTDAVTFYEYDLQHRVTALNYTEFVSPGNYIPYYRSEYTYNGADTLPYKSTDLDITSFSADTTITFFTFSGNRRIRDSSMEFQTISTPSYRNVSKYVINYQNLPGKIYGTSTATLLFTTDPNQTPGIPYISYDTATTDAAGNLLAFQSFDQSGVLGQSSSFTYDNKRNPFSLLSNYYALLVFPSNETFIDEMQAKNNRLHAHEVHSGTVFDEDLTGRYIYRADNLPVSVSNDDGSGTIYQTIFVYKAF